MTPLLILCLCWWQPTVNEQRIELDYYMDFEPYRLGCVAPSGYEHDVLATQLGRVIFEYHGGFEPRLAWITDPAPVYFYDEGGYVGRIVPEPSSVMLMLAGVIICKKKK